MQFFCGEKKQLAEVSEAGQSLPQRLMQKLQNDSMGQEEKWQT